MSKVCGAVVAADGTPCWLQHVGYWIHQHQTLIAGLLALAAAAVTVHFLRKQIAQQQRHHDEMIERKLRAMRAGLPIALVEIRQYAVACVAALRHLLQFNGDHLEEADWDETPQEATSGQLPPVRDYPVEAFKTVQALIEHADVENARRLQRIIVYGQIQNSRFRKLIGRIVHNEDRDWAVAAPNIMYAIRDAIGLEMLANAAFDYSREMTPDIHPLGDAQKAMETAMNHRLDVEVRQFVVDNWPPDFPRERP